MWLYRERINPFLSLKLHTWWGSCFPSCPRHPLALTTARLLKREKKNIFYIIRSRGKELDPTSPACVWKGNWSPTVQNHGLRAKCPKRPLNYLSSPSLFHESRFCRGTLYLRVLLLQLLKLYIYIYISFFLILFVIDIICMSLK